MQEKGKRESKSIYVERRWDLRATETPPHYWPFEDKVWGPHGCSDSLAVEFLRRSATRPDGAFSLEKEPKYARNNARMQGSHIGPSSLDCVKHFSPREITTSRRVKRGR